MKKKTVRTIEYEYDDNGILIKSIETINEEMIYTGIKPPNSSTDIGTKPFPPFPLGQPYDDWDWKPKTFNDIYTNEGLPPPIVTYNK